MTVGARGEGGVGRGRTKAMQGTREGKVSSGATSPTCCAGFSLGLSWLLSVWIFTFIYFLNLKRFSIKETNLLK